MSKVTMPKAGQSMEEGTILQWRKREGDRVEKGEILLEIDTDKATVEVEAPESGVLRKILCAEGETVPVLQPIAILAGATDDIAGGTGRGAIPAGGPGSARRPPEGLAGRARRRGSARGPALVARCGERSRRAALVDRRRRGRATGDAGAGGCAGLRP